MSTYKSEIIAAMQAIGSDPQSVFIGYNVGFGSKAGGTLTGIPDMQLIEMPLAENLMGGVAIGMAMEGYKPVIFFERFDFILNALDAIVNHLDKAKQISKGEFSPACIIRAVVGNTQKPLYTGVTHVQDFSEAMRHMVSFPVVQLMRKEDIASSYAEAYSALGEGRSTLLVEYKDLYDQQ